MKNLSFSNRYFYFTNIIVFALLMFLYVLQTSAQYDLLYENHQQDPGNVPKAVADDGQSNTWMAGYFNSSITLGAITLTNIPTYGQSSQTGFIGKFNSSSN